MHSGGNGGGCCYSYPKFFSRFGFFLSFEILLKGKDGNCRGMDKQHIQILDLSPGLPRSSLSSCSHHRLRSSGGETS